MLKDRFFLILLKVLVVLGALHLLGTMFYWYWELTYFDKLVHFLGGFWVGGMFLWFTFRYLFNTHPDQYFKLKILFMGLWFGLTIGLVWEFFEVFIGATGLNEVGYALDTITDLVADSSGALLAAYLYIRIKK